MGTTISSAQTVGVKLTVASQNPVTITDAGSVVAPGTYAIYGSNIYPWTIGNAGTLSAQATASSAIQLNGDGNIDNTGLITGVSIAGDGTVSNDGTIAGGLTTGIVLKSGGLVSNTASAAITGRNGLNVTYATIVNQGSIAGTRYGVASRGGTVTNQGVITGFYSAVHDKSGLVINENSIVGLGTFGIGVDLDSGATVVNQGSIQGSYSGIIVSGFAYGGSGTVANAASASITGLRDGIVAFVNGASVSNAGTIAGTGSSGIGVDLFTAGSTLTNAGTIIGGSGVAVYFGGYGGQYAGNLLVLDPGAVFSGAVSASASAANNIELASAGSSGTLSGLGSSFTNFGSISVDPGAAWILTGNNTLPSGAILTNAGSLALVNTTIGEVSTLVNNGVIILDPSDLTVGGMTGAGVAAIDSLSTLEVLGTVAAGETIAFAGISSVLQLGAPGSVAARIDGFTLTDTIDLTSLPIGNVNSVTIAPGNTLVVSQTSGPTVNLLLDPTQNFSGLVAHAASDGNSGTDITLTAPCFCTGTRIRTERGEIAVEDLREGDRVLTGLSGKSQPVIWIGHRAVDCKRHPRPQLVWPVRITAGAFGFGRPHRDLWLSPDHAVFIDDVLIPVKYLINERSIAQRPKDNVSYYHVELRRHAVLFAEGLPAESYLDIGDRTNFANGGGPMRLFPDFTPPRLDCVGLWEAKGCAPLSIVGPKVEAARRMLLATELMAKPPPRALPTPQCRSAAASRHRRARSFR